MAARIVDNGVVVRSKACSSRTPDVKGIQLESRRGLLFPRVFQPIPLEPGETICSHAIRLSPGHRGLCVAITGHSIKMRDRKTATAWPVPGCWSVYIFSPYHFCSTLLVAPRFSTLTTSFVVQRHRERDNLADQARNPRRYYLLVGFRPNPGPRWQQQR